MSLDVEPVYLNVQIRYQAFSQAPFILLPSRAIPGSWWVAHTAAAWILCGLESGRKEGLLSSGWTWSICWVWSKVPREMRILFIFFWVSYFWDSFIHLCHRILDMLFLNLKLNVFPHKICCLITWNAGWLLACLIPQETCSFLPFLEITCLSLIPFLHTGLQLGFFVCLFLAFDFSR